MLHRIDDTTRNSSYCTVTNDAARNSSYGREINDTTPGKALKREAPPASLSNFFI